MALCLSSSGNVLKKKNEQSYNIAWNETKIVGKRLEPLQITVTLNAHVGMFGKSVSSCCLLLCWSNLNKHKNAEKTARKRGRGSRVRTISGWIRSILLRDRRFSKSLGKFYKLSNVINGLKTELEVVLVYGLEREIFVILFWDVLVLEKNMVAFGATREIQRKFRKWIWWPELAGNDKKLTLVNSVVCVCLWCFAVRSGGSWGGRRQQAGSRLSGV